MAGSRPGPARKRDAERIRNTPSMPGTETIEISEDVLKSLPFKVDLLVEPPAADEGWHPVAVMLYESLLRDPARIWMGPTDWALSYLMCESISREMEPQAIGVVEGGIDFETGEKIAGHVAHEIVPMKGATIAAVLKWAGMIGITEAGRLALRREVSFGKEAPTPESKKTATKIVQDRRGTGLFSIEGGAAG